MDITNLKDSPEYVQKTLELIETSFEYEKKNHFNVDFYPLYNKDNFKNCFVLIKDNKVLAHIGKLEKILSINNKSYSVSMFGGIAVAKEVRGEGYFKGFFNELLKRETTTALSFLWSEKIDLYEKFQFFPCVSLQSYSHVKSTHSFDIENKNLIELNESELEQVKKLYDNSELRPLRTKTYWDDLKKITSAQLFLVKNKNKIINYFIKDKGQDLTNIIHEYGVIDENYLSLFQNYGQVWTTYQSSKLDAVELYGSISKINNKEIFRDFVLNYTGISIKNIKHNFVDFDFNNSEFQLSEKDFLQGIFGPGRFQELDKLPYLYICGLDSI